MRRVGLLFIGIGVLIALVMGVVVGISLKGRADRADWPSTTGVVVGLVGAGSTDDGDDLTAEIISYTVDEQSYVLRNPSASTSPQPIGAKLQVRYKPAYPSQAVIGGESNFVPVFLSGLGVFFLLVFGGLGLMLMRMDPGKAPSAGIGIDSGIENRRRPPGPDDRLRGDAAESMSRPPQPPPADDEWPTLDRRADPTRRDLR